MNECSFCHARPAYGCIECNPQYRTNNRIKKFGEHKVRNIWHLTKGKCWYCGVYMTPPIDSKHLAKDYLDKMFTIEHVIPVSKKGKNSKDNLLPACHRCNNTRGNASEEYLRMRLGFKKKWPEFTRKQFSFLLDCGINLASLCKYVFFFEREGLNDRGEKPD